MLVAPLPGGVHGHFGPELRRFVLMQHQQGQVTVERLVATLQGLGISISKRAVARLVSAGQEAFPGRESSRVVWDCEGLWLRGFQGGLSSAVAMAPSKWGQS